VVCLFVGERKIKMVHPKITTPALVLPISGDMYDTLWYSLHIDVKYLTINQECSNLVTAK